MTEETDYTEAELTGEETPSGEPPAGETPAVPEKEAVVPPGEKETPAEKPADTPAPPVEPEKPVETPAKEPEGKTVPLAALHEARVELRTLKGRLEQLEAGKEPPKSPSELVSEDPEQAIVSLYGKIQALEEQIYQNKMDSRIEKEVPDFLEKAPQYEELLLGMGFSEDSVVNMIGASGEDAPKFFKLLSTLIEQPNKESLRETVRAEEIPRITAEVTRQLMEKFKITDPGVSLTKVPGATVEGKIIAESEEEFAKLSPKEQEEWLSGG